MSCETGDEFKGISSHRAPELMYPERFGLRTSQVSKQADIYAFGIFIYEVLTGRPPFEAEKLLYLKIVLHVLGGGRPRKPENAGDIGFGGGTWELVQQCWHQDRDERPTVEKVSEHFQRVAGTSSIVPPGPTIPYFEGEAPIVSNFLEILVGALFSSRLTDRSHLAQHLQLDHSSLLHKGIRASSSRSGLPRTI